MLCVRINKIKLIHYCGYPYLEIYNLSDGFSILRIREIGPTKIQEEHNILLVLKLEADTISKRCRDLMRRTFVGFDVQISLQSI